MNTKKFLVWAGGITGALSVLLAFIALASYGLVLLPPVQQSALNIAEKELDSLIVGRVKIGRVRTNLLSRFDVYDVSIKDRAGLKDSIFIGHVRARYSLFALLRKQIRIHNILVDNVKTNLFVTSSGDYKVPVLPKCRNCPLRFNWKTSNLNLKIKRITIRNLDAQYVDSFLCMQGVLKNVKIQAGFPNLKILEIHMEVPDGFYGSPWWKGKIDNLVTDVVMDPFGMTIKKTRFKGAGTQIQGGGRIPFSLTGVWDLNAEVGTDVKPVLSIYRYIPGLENRGHVNAVASWKGTLQNPILFAEVKGSGIQYRQIKTDSINFKGTYSYDGYLKTWLSVSSSSGNIQVNSNTVMPELFINPKLEAYSADIQGNQIPFSLIPQLNKNKVFQSDMINFHSKIKGEGIKKIPSFVGIYAGVDGNKFRGYSLNINTELVSNLWSLNGNFGDNKIEGSGNIDIGKKSQVINGKMTAHISQPDLITKMLFNEMVSGNLTITSDLDGSLQHPKIYLLGQAKNLKWHSATADSAYAVISFVDNKFLIDKSFALVHAEIDSVLSRFGINNSGGSIYLKAEASGPICSPTVSADISGTGVSYKNIKADSITGEIHSSKTEGIKWNKLVVINGTTRLNSFGELKLKPDLSGNGVFTFQAKSGKKWLDQGSLSIRGILSQDSTHAEVNANELETASFSPWIKVNKKYSGRLSASGKINGPIKNLNGDLKFFLKNPSFDNLKINSLGGTFSLSDSLLNGTALIFLSGSSNQIKIGTTLPLKPSKGWVLEKTVSRSGEVTIEGESIDLSEFSIITEGGIKAKGSAKIHLIAKASKLNDWVIQGRATVKNAAVYDSIDGFNAANVNLTTGLSGSLQKPRIAFTFSSSSVLLPFGKIDSTFIQGLTGLDTMIIDTSIFYVQKGGKILLSGKFPLNNPDSILMKNGLSIKYQIEKLPIILFSPIAPENYIKDGFLNSNGVFSVIHNRPVLFGKASFNKVKLNVEGIEPFIGPLDADIGMSEDSIIIRKLTTKIGAGNIGATGFFTWNEAGFTDMKMDIKAKEPSFELPDIAQIRIQSSKLKLTKEREGFLLAGTVDLGDTRVIRDVKIADLVNQTGLNISNLKKQDWFLKQLALQLNVNFQENVTVDMNLGYLKVDGKIGVGGTYYSPGIRGDANVIEGYVLYLDRKFDVVQGTFYNPDPFELNPTIDLQAKSEVYTALDDNPYTINMNIQGTLTHPELHLSDADGEWDEANIISILTLGQPIGAVGSDIRNRIKNFAAQSIAGFGARKLEQLLRVERINLSGDLFPSQQQPEVTPKLSVTKRITSRLVVSYETVLSNLSRRKLSALFRLTKNFFLQGENDSEEDKESGLDLIFRYSK